MIAINRITAAVRRQPSPPTVDEQYAALVEAYVMHNVRMVRQPLLNWADVIAQVRKFGKSVDQFVRDWRSLNERLPTYDDEA